jgi:competence protein ComEC
MPSAVFILFLVSFLSPAPPTITFLDVGQGDATVLSVNRRAVIIDGGGNRWQPGANTGERVLMPYLDYKGIRMVEAAFLSHPHEDHAIGIIELMSAGRLKTLYMADVPHEPTPFFQEILYTAETYGTEIVYISAGDIIRFKDFTIEKLYPPQGFAGSANNQSQILRVTINNSTLLFTGDAELEAEINLIAMANHYNICLAADILKVPHHGSLSSSAQNFITAVSPRMAMAGVSERNPHNHPHPDVLARYTELNIPFLTTAENGAIMILPRENLYYTTMRDMGR